MTKFFSIYAIDTNTFKIGDEKNIKFIKNGFSVAYFLDILNIFYALYRRAFNVALLIIISLLLVGIMGYCLSLAEGTTTALYLSISIIFSFIGYDLEQFFLKLKGYKLIGIIRAKNIEMAREEFYNKLIAQGQTISI